MYIELNCRAGVFVVLSCEQKRPGSSDDYMFWPGPTVLQKWCPIPHKGDYSVPIILIWHGRVIQGLERELSSILFDQLISNLVFKFPIKFWLWTKQFSPTPRTLKANWRLHSLQRFCISILKCCLIWQNGDKLVCWLFGTGFGRGQVLPVFELCKLTGGSAYRQSAWGFQELWESQWVELHGKPGVNPQPPSIRSLRKHFFSVLLLLLLLLLYCWFYVQGFTRKGDSDARNHSTVSPNRLFSILSRSASAWNTRTTSSSPS